MSPHEWQELALEGYTFGLSILTYLVTIDFHYFTCTSTNKRCDKAALFSADNGNMKVRLNDDAIQPHFHIAANVTKFRASHSQQLAMQTDMAI